MTEHSTSSHPILRPGDGLPGAGTQIGHLIDLILLRPAQRAAAPGERTAFHACGACGSDLVDIVDGDEVRARLWHLTMGCADCGVQVSVTCDTAQLEALERELDRRVAGLREDLERFARMRFEEDAERFIAALHAGAILPMDFGSVGRARRTHPAR